LAIPNQSRVDEKGQQMKNMDQPPVITGYANLLRYLNVNGVRIDRSKLIKLKESKFVPYKQLGGKGSVLLFNRSIIDEVFNITPGETK
jgi:hypothetical protein